MPTHCWRRDRMALSAHECPAEAADKGLPFQDNLEGSGGKDTGGPDKQSMGNLINRCGPPRADPRMFCNVSHLLALACGLSLSPAFCCRESKCPSLPKGADQFYKVLLCLQCGVLVHTTCLTIPGQVRCTCDISPRN